MLCFDGAPPRRLVASVVCHVVVVVVVVVVTPLRLRGLPRHPSCQDDATSRLVSSLLVGPATGRHVMHYEPRRHVTELVLASSRQTAFVADDDKMLSR